MPHYYSLFNGFLVVMSCLFLHFDLLIIMISLIMAGRKNLLIIWIDIAMIWCGMAGLATEQERKDRISIQVVLSQSCCAAVLHVLLHQSIGGIILSHSTQNCVWCWLLWLHTSWWSHKFLVQPCAPSGVDCTDDITMCLVHWWHWRDEQAFRPGGLAASGANCSLH